MKTHVWQNEKQIQVDELHMDSIESFRIFWRDLQDKYPGFTIDFCYHNCAVPVDFMREINAEILEACIEARLSPKHFTPTCGHELTLVTNENFAEFAELHNNANPSSSGMFWTSERIFGDLSSWIIYMYKSCYVLTRLGRSNTAEIYALETADKGIGKALVSKASEHAFNAGKTDILRMVDDDAQAELEIVKVVGFMPCGKYIAYRTVVK